MEIKGVNPASTHSVSTNISAAFTTNGKSLLNCFKNTVNTDSYFENIGDNTIYMSVVKPHHLSDAEQTVIFDFDRDTFDVKRLRFNGLAIMPKQFSPTIRFRLSDSNKNLYWFADYYKQSNILLVPYQAADNSSMRGLYNKVVAFLFDNGYVVEKIERVTIDIGAYIEFKTIFNDTTYDQSTDVVKSIDELIANVEKIFSEISKHQIRLDNPINIRFNIKDFSFRNNRSTNITSVYNYFIINIITKYNTYNYGKMNITDDYVISVLPCMFNDKKAFKIFLNVIYNIAKMYNEEKTFVINESQRFAKENEIAAQLNVDIKDVKYLFKVIKEMKELPRMSKVDAINIWNGATAKPAVAIPTQPNNKIDVIFKKSDVFSSLMKSFIKGKLENINCKYKTINFYGFKDTKGTVVTTIDVDGATKIHNPTKYSNTNDTINIGLPYIWRAEPTQEKLNTIVSAIVTFINRESEA